MSDTIKGFVVTLRPDVREDVAERIAEAIKMLHGVIKVEPLVEHFDDLIARNQAKRELREKMWELLKDDR